MKNKWKNGVQKKWNLWRLSIGRNFLVGLTQILFFRRPKQGVERIFVLIFLFFSLLSNAENAMLVGVLNRQRSCAVLYLVYSNEVVGEFEHVRA